MGRKIQTFSLLILLGLSFGSASAATYSDADAAAHVGDSATIVGIVTGTHVTTKGTEFIDFGPRYPNQDFTAVIFGTDAAQIGDVAKYDGKRVAVTGVIQLYRGKPEIIVRSSGQISVQP